MALDGSNPRKKVRTQTDFESSRWADLHADVLRSIADHLVPEIGILQLRSTCRSWRSALSLSTISSSSSSSSSSSQSSIKFPLKLPYPISPTTSHSRLRTLPSHLCLCLNTVYLLSPHGDTSNEFLIKVEEVNKPNTFSLLNPLYSNKPRKPNSPLSLLNYGVHLIHELYILKPVDDMVRHYPIGIQKVVVAKNFFTDGDFVVLVLEYNGGLLLWRFGDEKWTEIMADGHCFQDIISYQGKFYATAGKKGKLAMIDSSLRPIFMVPNLMYGCGKFAHLVECNGGLYLVDPVRNGQGLEFGVFKLDDKGRFWDYEVNLNGNVFFLGYDANFSVSHKVYDGCRRNSIYFASTIGTDNRLSEFVNVFDMEKVAIRPVADFEALYWPPLSWFDDEACFT